MELAQRHMERELLFTDPSEAVHGEIDAFADTDPRSSHEAQSIGLQGIVVTEFLLQALILLQGKRSRQIAVTRGKVLATNEVGRERMAPVS
jgi:hypothetical protein